MSENHYLKAITQFQHSNSLCDFFQVLAVDTWERIKFARTRKGLKIYETTITQNLLFELNRTKEFINNKYGTNYWDFKIYESINEKANGNDIELYLPYNGGYLLFPIQAKLINHKGYKRKKMNDGDYRAMDHFVPSTSSQQIDSLLDYAKKMRAIPLYLLYNYVNTTLQNKVICSVNMPIEQYGCSISSALYIHNNYYSGGAWKIPKFSDLHPGIAQPWFILTCCSLKKDNLSDYFAIDKDEISKIKIYSLSEIERTSEWKEFESNSGSVINYDNNPNQKGFVPKFRIILRAPFFADQQIPNSNA